jgi:histolysain
MDWGNVQGRDDLPDGNYAAAPFDQHVVNWCGCCYLVAAVQTVEDRIFLLRRRRGNASPRETLSIQVVLDHFKDLEAGPGWNACLGGFSLHVFQCLTSGVCPLVKDDGTYKGHPQTTSNTPLSSFRVKVANPRRVPHKAVKEELQNGPVVLELNARTCKSLDAKGVVADLTPRDPNHAVSVIGWKSVDGVECYIVRNSWGTARAPVALPDDLDCVSIDGNDCKVRWEVWKGDPARPGFLYVPISFGPLNRSRPSPWIVADVVEA